MIVTSLREGDLRRWYRNLGAYTRVTCEEGRIRLRMHHNGVYHNTEVIPGVTWDVPPRHYYGYQAIDGPATVMETPDYGRINVDREHVDEDTAGLRW